MRAWGIVAVLLLSASAVNGQQPGPVDFCSLLTKPDLEALVGRTVVAPRGDRVINLTTCKAGDPTAPLLNGRPVDDVVEWAVVVLETPAQAKAVQETGRANAGEVQVVNGIGDAAYWDEVRTLQIVKGRYQVSVTVAAELGLAVARRVAVKLLAGLP